jgi:teichuronic acid biosynthesis glycosyltransferase TuaG
MNNKSIISVIIPFYKEVDLIGRAVESVAIQQLPSNFTLEIIIGNDSDMSEERIYKCIPQHIRPMVKIAKNINAKGAGNARNTALGLARGEIFFFLDADDFWMPNKLLTQCNILKSGANFIAAAYKFNGTNLSITPPKEIKCGKDVFKNTSIGTSTVCVTKELLGNSRFTNIKTSQDTQFWASLAEKCIFRYDKLNDVFVVYSPSDRTSNKIKQFNNFNNLIQSISYLTLLDKAYILIRYALRGIQNHFFKKCFTHR